MQISLTALILIAAALTYLFWNERSKLQAAASEILKIKHELTAEKIEKEGLQHLTEEQGENLDLLAAELEKITGTVNILERLQDTDEELLQKYSKVYFLNEHYIPSSLKAVPDDYVDSKDETEKVHSKIFAHLVDLLEDADKDDVRLRIVSAYRSFNEQSELKSGYTVTYGAGANAFSADQGYSEHQLGTAVDFSLDGRERVLDGFENTQGYKWLNENAHNYGFILSYPEGNSYYIFEPWHWRYVGVKLATKLQNENDKFYDWDQRKIDEYLIDLFD